MKKIVSIILLLTLTLWAAPAYAASVSVTLPNFNVYLNGTKVENSSRQYPLIVYNDITYFPMTYFDCRFLGLETAYSLQAGLDINKTGVAGPYNDYATSVKNPQKATARTADFAIRVNGKSVDNKKEQYPLLLFKDVTYFPLTWRFAVDEFGWDYHFSNERGLEINSIKTVTPTVPVPPAPAAPIVVIDSIYANRVEIDAGDPVVLTIRTNTAAGYVWVKYDTTDVSAIYTSTDSLGYLIWTVTCYPAKSQNLEIYANTNRTTNDAVRRAQGITVNTNDVLILQTDADRTTVNYGEPVNLTVQTNIEATEVWAETEAGTRINFNYQYTSGARKIWYGVYYPENTSTLLIYAKKSGSRVDKDSVRINVNRAEAPSIGAVTVDPGFVINAAGVQKNNFHVTTNKSVTSVYVDFNGKRYYANTLPIALGNESIWTIDAVPLEWSAQVVPLGASINPGGASFSVTVYAANQDGRVASKSVSITIRPGLNPL